LVSTSIGEEGLDIGEVDLIICYDSQSSIVVIEFHHHDTYDIVDTTSW
jgi:Lhr-like helicase